jgi:hypothetical protein
LETSGRRSPAAQGKEISVTLACLSLVLLLSAPQPGGGSANRRRRAQGDFARRWREWRRVSAWDGVVIEFFLRLRREGTDWKVDR